MEQHNMDRTSYNPTADLLIHRLRMLTNVNTELTDEQRSELYWKVADTWRKLDEYLSKQGQFPTNWLRAK